MCQIENLFQIQNNFRYLVGPRKIGADTEKSQNFCQEISLDVGKSRSNRQILLKSRQFQKNCVRLLGYYKALINRKMSLGRKIMPESENFKLFRSYDRRRKNVLDQKSCSRLRNIPARRQKKTLLSQDAILEKKSLGQKICFRFRNIWIDPENRSRYRKIAKFIRKTTLYSEKSRRIKKNLAA